MRLMTWNCRVGGFRWKAKHVAPLRPDVLAVQEVERLDSVLLFAGQCQPTYRDRVGDPVYPKRAIGMFSYTDTKLKSVDEADPMYGFRRYEAQHGNLTFQVAAVWTAKTKSRETSYQQAHDGLRRHAEWIRQRPTVVLGDFNDNASYRGPNWRQLLDLVQPLGLVSAYHEFFAEAFGSETRDTYFHSGKTATKAHLDYCFVPGAWKEFIRRVEVGRHADWRELSDHVPVIVDVDPSVVRLAV